MTTNKARREAERRRLQRQLEERRRKQAAQKRFTLIASIVGTLVVIAGIVVIIVIVGRKHSPGSTNAAANGTESPTASTTPTSSTPSASAVPVPTAACVVPTGKATASFQGVTVGQATNLKHEPKVSAKSTGTPTALACADLVVGKGKTATPTSTVSVQYTGVLDANGKQFDSSWARGGKPIDFSLTGVVPGFTQGIGGAGKVVAMREGGRRIIIVPAPLGYGSSGSGNVPPNAAIVFVVDLVKVS